MEPKDISEIVDTVVEYYGGNRKVQYKGFHITEEEKKWGQSDGTVSDSTPNQAYSNTPLSF